MPQSAQGVNFPSPTISLAGCGELFRVICMWVGKLWHVDRGLVLAELHADRFLPPHGGVCSLPLRCRAPKDLGSWCKRIFNFATSKELRQDLEGRLLELWVDTLLFALGPPLKV